MEIITSKIVRIVCIATLLFTSASCNKSWLEPKPLSFLSPENTFNTREGIETLLNKCRSGLRIEFMGRGCRVATDYWFSDMGVQVNGSPRNMVTDFVPAMGTSTAVWNAHFTDLKYANMVIGRAIALNATETVKNSLKAEGMFFRAYWYYKLVNEFGDVPLILTEISTPKLDFKSATKRKILATMITDLEFAVQYLPEDAPNGVINKAAGQHLLTKFYLQVGRFQDAVNMATNILSNSKYALMKTRFGIDAADMTKNVMWDLFHKYNASMSNNTEKILVVQDYPSIVGGTSGSERMREFLTEWYKNQNDSKAKQATTDGINGEPQISTTGRGIGKIKQSEYHGYKLWKDAGDMRHKAPCWVPVSSLVYNVKSSVDYGKNLVKAQCKDTLRAWDDIYWNKIVVEDELLAKGQGINIMGGCMDWYVFRLAETYLLRAEAYTWLGKSSEAASDINQVRTRAGAAPLPSSDGTLENVIDERARELFLEEFRCIELKRISYTMALLKLNGYAMETISEKNYYYDKVIQNNQFYRNKFVYNGMIYSIAPYHIYWPIPESAIQDNTLATLNQNFGYVGYERNIQPED